MQKAVCRKRESASKMVIADDGLQNLKWWIARRGDTEIGRSGYQDIRETGD
jgi:hypothetical protein